MGLKNEQQQTISLKYYELVVSPPQNQLEWGPLYFETHCFFNINFFLPSVPKSECEHNHNKDRRVSKKRQKTYSESHDDIKMMRQATDIVQNRNAEMLYPMLYKKQLKYIWSSFSKMPIAVHRVRKI